MTMKVDRLDPDEVASWRTSAGESCEICERRFNYDEALVVIQKGQSWEHAELWFHGACASIYLLERALRRLEERLDRVEAPPRSTLP